MLYFIVGLAAAVVVLMGMTILFGLPFGNP